MSSSFNEGFMNRDNQIDGSVSSLHPYDFNPVKFEISQNESNFIQEYSFEKEEEQVSFVLIFDIILTG